MNRYASIWFAAAAAIAAASAPAQDSLQLNDGRFVVDKKMTKDETGVMVHFKNGDVHIENAMIKSTTARNAAGEQASLSAEAKENLAKGLVLYKGRWIMKKIRDAAIEKDKEKRAAMIAEAKKHREWKDHYTLKTRNFEFQYTIDPEVMKGYADLMETYYKEFTKEWRIRKPPKIGRLKVCFYHDDDYYYQVSGAPTGAIGYFRFVEPIELNFFYDRLDEELTIDVMFHETNHFLTHLIDPKFHYPAWVNESLAEYYGASEWDPKTKKMKVGGIQEGRLAVIQDMTKLNTAAGSGTGSADDKGSWQGLEELIRMERFDAIHYAWGWTFVHFLMQNKKYEPKFKKYYLALAKDKRIKKVLARGGYNLRTVEADEQIKWLKNFLGVSDLKTLEKEWHDYIKTLNQATHRGYQQAGRIALMRNKPIKAERLYNTAIDMGSKNPMTYYGLCRAQYRKQKYQEALAAIDKALAGDPLNGMFYIWKAKCLQRGGKDETDPMVKRLKRLALEIEPDNYDVMLEVAWDQAINDEGKEGDGK